MVQGARRAILLVAALAMGLASTGPASAAPGPASPADFDAPLFGTTATLTEGRMPTSVQVRCSDARCTRGVLTVAELGPTVYVGDDVARGGVFADSPFFEAKLNKHWTNFATNSESAGAAASDYSSFTLHLAQIRQGADIPGLVAADLARYGGGSLSAPRTIGGATVWQATADDKDASWTFSYVSSGDALARGICMQVGSERGSVTCQPANVEALTLGAVTAPPSTAIAEQGSIRGLIPSTPPGLQPLLLTIEPAQALWAGYGPTPSLVRALSARKNAVTLQYEVSRFPELVLSAKVAAVKGGAPARMWANSTCSTAAVSSNQCALSRLPAPVFGSLGVRNDPNNGGTPQRVTSRFTGAGKLGDATCYVARENTTMTPAQVSACREAITALASTIVK